MSLAAARSTSDKSMSGGGRIKNLNIMSGFGSDGSASSCSTMEKNNTLARPALQANSANAADFFVLHNGRKIVKKKKRQCVKCELNIEIVQTKSCFFRCWYAPNAILQYSEHVIGSSYSLESFKISPLSSRS